jgi:hypothetical protein
MKVLYILWNYPQISETYIDVEIKFAVACGIDVHVWSMESRHPNLTKSCPVHRGTLLDAIVKVQPHLIHCHYLPVAETYAPAIPKAIPITVRGHSFDWSVDALRRVAAIPQVRKIFLFPHFAAQVPDVKKVQSLPVAFHPRSLLDDFKSHRMVLRLAAALPTKGLSDFFAVAERLSDDFRFVLGVARAGGADDYPERLVEQSKKLGGLVDVRIDVLPDEAWELYRRASIYLDTADPKGHPFGMPISIVEAWSQGAVVLARDGPEARNYMGGQTYCYRSVSEAAELIAKTRPWELNRWGQEACAARLRAAPFTDEQILPVLIKDWYRVLGMVP